MLARASSETRAALGMVMVKENGTKRSTRVRSDNASRVKNRFASAWTCAFIEEYPDLERPLLKLENRRRERAVTRSRPVEDDRRTATHPNATIFSLSAGDTNPAVIRTEQSGSESLCSLLNSGSGNEIRMSVRSGHRCVASGIHRKANELPTGCKVRFFVRQAGKF